MYQGNGSDCGVYMLLCASCIVDDLPFDFCQDDIGQVRRRMLWSIIHLRMQIAGAVAERLRFFWASKKTVAAYILLVTNACTGGGMYVLPSNLLATSENYRSITAPVLSFSLSFYIKHGPYLRPSMPSKVGVG